MRSIARRDSMRSAFDRSCNARYAVGLLRALLGAMVFALPLLMTMEMWELGVSIAPERLALLLVLTFPMLVALSYYAGFERTFSLADNVLDAFAAIAVSTAACALVLWLFGELGADTNLETAVGKLSVLSFAACIGAMLADKQFNDTPDDDNADEGGEQSGSGHRNLYASRLFVMGVGAIFLALNIAPTEEVSVIAARMSPPETLALLTLSLLSLGAILTSVDRIETGRRRWPGALRILSGYGLCLLICGYILWTFGRMDGASASGVLDQVVVLAFPASLGAGAARLILGARMNDG